LAFFGVSLCGYFAIAFLQRDWSGGMPVFDKNKEQNPATMQRGNLESSRAKCRKIVQIIVSVGLTVLIGYIIYRDVPDWRQSLLVMVQGSPLMLSAGVFFVFLHMLFRAARWGALLSTSKPNILFKNLLSLTFIKYVVNLIPPRTGELAASILLAKKENMSSATVIAASFFERVLDLITVFAIFMFYLAFWCPDVAEESKTGRAIIYSVRSYSVSGLLILGICFVILIFLLRGAHWTTRIPLKCRAPILRFLDGFRALQSHGVMLRVIFFSLAIWLCITLQLWFLLRSYITTFPLAGSALMVVLTAVGVAIPTPGGIGGFQYFMTLALVSFFWQHLSPQDPHTQAVGISNGCYMASTIPVFIAGLVLLNKEGVSLGRISRLSESRQSDIEQ
jgi:glycosyltransferase 2 family protein